MEYWKNGKRAYYHSSSHPNSQYSTFSSFQPSIIFLPLLHYSNPPPLYHSTVPKPNSEFGLGPVFRSFSGRGFVFTGDRLPVFVFQTSVFAFSYDVTSRRGKLDTDYLIFTGYLSLITDYRLLKSPPQVEIQGTLPPFAESASQIQRSDEGVHTQKEGTGKEQGIENGVIQIVPHVARLEGQTNVNGSLCHERSEVARDAMVIYAPYDALVLPDLCWFL